MFHAVDFSEKAVFTGPQPSFSPDGRHIAMAQEYRLVVRDVESMAVVGLFSCLDSIEAISWSPNGELILCAMYERGTAQVFSLNDPAWSCSITEGLAGICSTSWHPNSQQVVLVSDFSVKLSVWSLVDQSCHNLPPPKHQDAGIGFNPEGTMLAVLERSECKDYLVVYDATTWEAIARCPLTTIDAADFSWSPDSSSIACWDSPAQSPLLLIIAPESGEIITEHRSFSYGLGIKKVSWSPSGQLVALGTYENDLKVLNNVTWTSLASFTHGASIQGPATAIVYKEETPSTAAAEAAANQSNAPSSSSSRPNSPTKQKTGMPLSNPPSPTKRPTSQRSTSPTKPGPSARGRVFNDPDAGKPSTTASGRVRLTRKAPLATSKPRPASLSLASQLDNPAGLYGDIDTDVSKYVIASLPVQIQAIKPPTDRPNPKLGTGIIAWSPDGAYVATRCDDRPNVMWIWDTAKLELASVLIQAAPIRAAVWAPLGGSDGCKLAVTCGTGRIYFWTPQGASSTQIPSEGLKITALQWSPEGNALMAMTRDAMMCGYLGGCAPLYGMAA